VKLSQAMGNIGDLSSIVEEISKLKTDKRPPAMDCTKLFKSFGCCETTSSTLAVGI
jgi:hypothetical protein